MQSACKMYNLREDMEHQCLCEDSKTRVYVSLVRDIDAQERRKARKKRRFFRKVRAWVKEVLIVIGSIGIGAVTYFELARRMAEVRGYNAIGGEILCACMVTYLAWLWLQRGFENL